MLSAATKRPGATALSMVLAAALCTAAAAFAQAPAAVTRDEVAAALRSGDVAALDARLGALQRAYEADPAGEAALGTAFGWFRSVDLPDADTQAALDRWVEEFPRSYPALLARGIHAVGRGMRARGEGWARDTSREQFDAMERHFERGRADLDASLEFAAKPLLSRKELMSAALRSGWGEDFERHYAAAEAFAPRSIGLRLLYMQRLEPRWGGSYAAMEDYVQRSAPVLGPGRDLDRLKAMIPADKASALAERDPQRAIALYSEALALADRARYRCARAWLRVRADRAGEAMEDLAAAAAQGQDAGRCHHAVLAIARNNWQAPGVLDLLDAFIAAAPDEVHLLNQRGWMRQQRGEAAAALADYRRAAELGDAWASTMTGKFLFSGTGGVAVDREQALQWLRRAAEKGEPNAQLSLVQALEAMGRRDEAAGEKARFAGAKAGSGKGAAAGSSPGDDTVRTVNLLLGAGAIALLVALVFVLRMNRR